MPRINNHQFYSSALKTYGQTPRGVNWLSKENQTLRFDAILELLPQNLDSISIGDAGCGFGDFYTYIKSKPKNYLGIDSLKEMQNIAAKQTNSKILLADITKDKLPTMDYYICSGALNILTLFETHQFIVNCYKASKKGFIFNTLYGDKKSETYNYLNKEKIKNIAKDLDVKKIIYKKAYLDNDITVGFYR
jgi:SAM-dependent methyltransferase